MVGYAVLKTVHPTTKLAAWINDLSLLVVVAEGSIYRISHVSLDTVSRLSQDRQVFFVCSFVARLIATYIHATVKVHPSTMDILT